MKRVLLLEDNTSTRAHLACIIKEIDIKTEIYEFDKADDAYKCALERRIDLFIIDIILDTRIPGDASGLKFLEVMRQCDCYKHIPAIIITCMEDTKFYTYDYLHCYRFIEKPFDVDRVRETIQECLMHPGLNNPKHTLFFGEDRVVLAVEEKDIVYIECLKRKVHIHTANAGVLTVSYVAIKKLRDEIQDEDIIQCNRSTLLNKRFVRNVDITNRVIQFKDRYGSVEIGPRYKDYVKKEFS